MSYEVAVTGALIGSWCALGAAVAVAVRRGARLRASTVGRGAGSAGVGCCAAMTTRTPAWPGADEPWETVSTVALSAGLVGDAAGLVEQPGPGLGSETTVAIAVDAAREAALDVDLDVDYDQSRFDGLRFDDTSQAALAACVFATAPAEHVWWTVIIMDPALHGTPSHMRLVGHYETEFAAVDAADRLAVELNACLVPGEAPITATAIGVEPEAPSGGPGAHVAAPMRPGAEPGDPAGGIRRPGPVSDGAPAQRGGTPISRR